MREHPELDMAHPRRQLVIALAHFAPPLLLDPLGKVEGGNHLGLDLGRNAEQAERQRFDMGDSTMLFVNIREQGTFDAAIREVDALLDHHKALALYRAVVAAP